MVFYDKDEIESTKQWQQENLFDELVQQRLQAVDFSISANKIDIMHFAPKIEDIAKNPGGKAKKSKGRTKSLKSSQTGEMGEEQILNEVEADEILAEQQRKEKEEALKKQQELDKLKSNLDDLIEKELTGTDRPNETSERELITKNKKKGSKSSELSASSNKDDKKPKGLAAHATEIKKEEKKQAADNFGDEAAAKIKRKDTKKK